MKTGAALRDDGISRAYQHALAIDAAWGDDAYFWLNRFIAQSVGEKFMTEDVRMWLGSRLSAPPHERAWGHIIRRAAKAGIIVKDGYAMCKDPGQHRTPATLWRIVR